MQTGASRVLPPMQGQDRRPWAMLVDERWNQNLAWIYEHQRSAYANLYAFYQETKLYRDAARKRLKAECEGVDVPALRDDLAHYNALVAEISRQGTPDDEEGQAVGDALHAELVALAPRAARARRIEDLAIEEDAWDYDFLWAWLEQQALMTQPVRGRRADQLVQAMIGIQDQKVKMASAIRGDRPLGMKDDDEKV